MKTNPAQVLYIIGVVLSGVIIIVLGLAALSTIGICGLGSAEGYLSCVAQYFSIAGALIILLLASCLTARKRPYIGAAILIIPGLIIGGILLFASTESSTFLFAVPLIIPGLLFLISGSLRMEQNTTKDAASISPNST